MLMRDFHVHGVELTGLFLAQLPQRLARLSSRGERLHREGWDINTLYLLADDAATLASACRDLDAGELADCLEALSATVQPLFDPPRVPDSASALASPRSFASSRKSRCRSRCRRRPSQAGVVVPGRSQDQGFPLLVTPPAEYWLRFAGNECARADSGRGCRSAVGDIAKPPSDISTAASAPAAAAEPVASAESEAALPGAPPMRHAAPTHKTAYPPRPRRAAVHRNRSLSFRAGLSAHHIRQR